MLPCGPSGYQAEVHQRLKKLKGQLYRADETRMWLHFDQLTEIESAKQLFRLLYDALFAEPKTRDDRFEDWTRARAPGVAD